MIASLGNLTLADNKILIPKLWEQTKVTTPVSG